MILKPVQDGFLADVVVRVVDALECSVDRHKDGVVGGGG